jgi:hypothetical protein
MIKIIEKKYRINNEVKKAAYVSFTGSRAASMEAEYSAKLLKILDNRYGTFIFQINDKSLFDVLTIKLITKFSRSYGRAVGLLVDDKLYNALKNLNLPENIITDTNERTILQQLAAR